MTAKNTLFTLLFLAAMSANAAIFRFGPRLGFGVGKVLGTSDLGKDGSASLGAFLGGVTQLEFDHLVFEAGVNYQSRVHIFVDKRDLDGDNGEDKRTITVNLSSLEFPITVFYPMRTASGFFKFGGGLAPEFGIGRVHYKEKAYFTSDPDVDDSQSVSYGSAGIKTFDLELVGQFGYQFNFTGWALSLDLTPKYGLINRNSDSFGNSGSYHTFLAEFGASFLF